MDVLPQVITAAATIFGVALTLYFNGRRENARMERQFKFEREKVLAADRLKVVIRTAHVLQRIRELVSAREAVLYGDRSSEISSWQTSFQSFLDEIFMLETELRVLAPELASFVRDAVRQARFIRDMDWDPSRENLEDESGVFIKYDSCVHDVMDEMQLLFGTQLPEEVDAQPRPRPLAPPRRRI